MVRFQLYGNLPNTALPLFKQKRLYILNSDREFISVCRHIRVKNSNSPRDKRFCCTKKIICQNRDSKNILLQQQNVQFYQQNVWLLQENFWLQQQKIYLLSIILLPKQNHIFP